MASSKKKWVAFKGNSTVPAEVVGEKEAKKMQAGKPVNLPISYADHVVSEGFADYCEAPKKKAVAKKSAAKKSAELTTEKTAAAEKAVTDAQAALDAVGLGKPAGPEIAALKAAKDAFEALQG